jgi:hypothetical protein
MPRGGVNPQDAGTRKADVSRMAELMPLTPAQPPVKHTCLAKAQQGERCPWAVPKGVLAGSPSVLPGDDI